MKESKKFKKNENKENFANCNKENNYNLLKEKNKKKMKSTLGLIFKNETNILKKNSKNVKSNLRIKKLKKRKIYFKSSRYTKKIKFDCFIDVAKITFVQKNLEKLISQVI